MNIQDLDYFTRYRASKEFVDAYLCACAHVLRHTREYAFAPVRTLDVLMDSAERRDFPPLEAITELVAWVTERDDTREKHAALAREHRDVDKRIARLVAAVETAGDIAVLARQLRELEARKVAIDGELRSVQPVPRLAPAVIENRLAEWRRLLRQSTRKGGPYCSGC